MSSSFIHLAIYYWFRKYYHDQLELITKIEDILVPKSDDAKNDATAYENKYKRTIKILTMVTLFTNLVCSNLFRIFFINYYLFFIEVSSHLQNSRCSDIIISFSRFFSCRQCCWSSNQYYSHLDSSKDQKTRCL